MFNIFDPVKKIKCPKCRKQVDSREKKCPHCGNLLYDKKELIVHCWNCGSRISINDDTCRNCFHWNKNKM